MSESENKNVKPLTIEEEIELRKKEIEAKIHSITESDIEPVKAEQEVPVQEKIQTDIILVEDITDESIELTDSIDSSHSIHSTDSIHSTHSIHSTDSIHSTHSIHSTDSIHSTHSIHSTDSIHSKDSIHSTDPKLITKAA